MNSLNLNSVQNRFIQLQNSIEETITSPNGEISVTFNGKVQITELTIKNTTPSNLESILAETINAGLNNVSTRLKNVMLLLQQEVQNDKIKKSF